MRELITTILLLTSTSSFAQVCDTKVESVVETREDVNTPVPKSLKDATIIVKMKDGSTREMKAEEFKVVPRKQQLKVKSEIITQNVNCTPAPPVVVTQTVVEKPKNILSLTVKRSLGDYTVNQQVSSFRFENEYSTALGLMYQRNVYRSWYLGLDVDTHRAVGANLGYGF